MGTKLEPVTFVRNMPSRDTKWPRKHALGTLALACVLAFSWGCGSGGTTGSGTDGQANGTAAGKDSGKPRIALVMKSLANEFFKTMEEGARAHNEAHSGDYELITQGIKNETDVARQIQIMEQLTASGVDAIIISPADSKALVSVCKKAMDAGVIVVNIDNKFDDDVLLDKDVKIPFVGPDNHKGARMVANYVTDNLDPGSPVAVLEGAPNAFNAIQRQLGIEEALNEAGMAIVASQTAHWEMAEANTKAAAILAEHPEIKAIVCANDSMALGAIAALKDAGMAGEILVSGYDNISAVQELMEQGLIIATADQHADHLAVYGIEYALEMLRGEDVPENRETPTDLVVAENGTLRTIPQAAAVATDPGLTPE